MIWPHEFHMFNNIASLASALTKPPSTALVSGLSQKASIHMAPSLGSFLRYFSIILRLSSCFLQSDAQCFLQEGQRLVGTLATHGVQYFWELHRKPSKTTDISRIDESLRIARLKVSSINLLVDARGSRMPGRWHLELSSRAFRLHLGASDAWKHIPLE